MLATLIRTFTIRNASFQAARWNQTVSLKCGTPLRLYSDKSGESDEPKFDMENPFEKEHVQCILCKHKIIPDYKNVRLLSQFQSPYTGRIYGRHITGLCKKQQELVEQEITKAQSAGLMSSYLKDPKFLRDPELFDVEKPIRPHRF